MPERRGNRGGRDPDDSCLGSSAVALAATEVEIVSIKILEFTAHTIVVGYKSLPGNRPQTNGNRLWLWEGTVIDWTHPDQGINDPVCLNESKGSCSMSYEISRKDYIVGYSVTSDVMGICASAVLTAGKLMLAPPSVTLSIETLTPLIISYATLRGYRPLTAGNWLGLWRGDTVPWNTPPPTEWCLPEDDANEGLVHLVTQLRPKSTYTVIYFMADKQNQTQNTSAAAVLRFDTS